MQMTNCSLDSRTVLLSVEARGAGSLSQPDDLVRDGVMKLYVLA